ITSSASLTTTALRLWVPISTPTIAMTRYHIPVNFFGHALVASWRSRAPAFALGAMLPDFASMCRARVEVVGHADLAAGVDWHHETDRVFHAAGAFRRLVADA